MTINYQKAKEFLQEREKIHQKEIDTLFKQARKDFDAIVEMLIEKYRPQKIYQWGSLLNRSHFSNISDIDIALVGDFPPEKFFAIFGEADDMTEFSLHMVELEKIEPLYAESIKKNGRLVYER